MLGRLISLAVISGIFSKKDDELDILPPPPPFPEIGKESGEVKEAERIREQKQKEIELERKEEGKERRRKDEERKKAELRKKREKELKEKRKARGKKVFDFFHDLELVKTEKEKKEYRRQKQKESEQRKLEKKREEEGRRKVEEERQKDFERERREQERRKQQEEARKEKELEKKQKELEDLEKIAPEPVKGKKAKLEVPELISLKAEEFEKETAKPEEVAKAEDEIQKAISGMKKAERPSIVKGLFKRKKPVEEKIETPEVMPRTYDKIDHVELIEESIHKARLALMDFKFDEAKRIYIEIMKMYNELELKKKSKVYQDIKDLYYERKSAEKFVK